MPGLRVAAAALLVAAAVAGCGGGASAGTASPRGPGSPGSQSPGTTTAGAVTVLAPTSLKGALDAVGAAFEDAHPGMKVTVSYGHVPALLAQIAQGVPADVLVTPDEVTMKQAETQGVVGPATVALARNRLVLVVPAGGTGTVKGVTSLGDRTLTIAVCAPELPCGKLTAQLAAKAGITLSADSQEPGGSPAVVTKAAAGEIDLGVCFATDTKAGAGKVTTVPLDDALETSATVTAAVLTSPAHDRAAEEFRGFLASAEGKALFTRAGFAAL